MILKAEYPILEFDHHQEAVINPQNFAQSLEMFDSEYLIITFFGEALEKMQQQNRIAPYRIINGENPVIIYKFTDANIMIVHGQVGCPACGGNLDLFHYLGAKKVMFCGGGGVLDRSIQVGEILVVEGAIRDEGFSYHYVAPSRYIYANPCVNEKIISYLTNKKIPHLKGVVWTTDAIYRETIDRVRLRKEEGAKIVEMEQAGCLAVAQFRGFDYGALIYGGDDVSSEIWDKRNWRSREGIRYELLMLCKELVQII